MAEHRVLIVEDDVPLTFALRSRFEREGFTVDTAAEGYAAITLLREHRYDAVMLDLIIHSGLNGFGVLNFLDIEQPEMLERVFLITGMPEQTVINTAPALLPRLYRKPFDDRALVQAVHDTMRRDEAPNAEHAETSTVLLVEDDRSVATVAQAALAMVGFTSTIASDGREAVDCLSRSDFRAVLLDLVIPNIDGFGVLDYMSRMRPAMLSRTIVMTGLPLPYRQRLELYEICGVIEKPLDLRELRALIAQCADK